MPRVSDDDLRAVMRLRAAGKPGPGLRQRIRRATGQPQEPRVVAVLPSVARRRTILVRFSAMGGIVAILILAPLAGALPNVGQPPDRLTGLEIQDGVVADAGDADNQDDDQDDQDDQDDSEDDDDEDDAEDDDDEDDDEDDQEPEEGE